MDLKQLKASMQLAQMRLNSVPSAANQQLFDQAKDVYENAKNPESQKNDQVSVDSLSLADLAHKEAQKVAKDQSTAIKDLGKVVKPATKPKPALETPIAPAPPATDQNTDQLNEGSEQEKESEGTSEEKKTEEA